MLRIASGPTNARVMIVGEAPSFDEEKARTPFTGVQGYELTKMLMEAGINRNECYFTNVTSMRPPGNDIDLFFFSKAEAKLLQLTPFFGVYPKAELIAGIDDLQKQIQLVKPEIIIALGNVPLWALTGLTKVSKDGTPTGVMNWRASWLDLAPMYEHKCSVFPTIHPGMVIHDWSNRFLVVKDFQRVAGALRSGVPQRPDWKFAVAPTFDQVIQQLDEWLQISRYTGHIYAVDIETRGRQIACVGIAPDRHSALCIPFMSATNISGYWSEAEELQIILKLREFLTDRGTKCIFHNGAYDCQYFAHQWGYIPNITDDTMVLQHVCFSGLRKSLAMCSSLYCHWHRYWKDDGKDWEPHMGEQQLWIYNCEDCVRTMECWEALKGICNYLGQNEQYYFQIRELFPLVLRAMLEGVRIDFSRRKEYDERLAKEMENSQRYFETVLGHRLNPRSYPQMQSLFYTDFGIPKIRSRKTGSATTDDAALEKIKAKYPLLAPLVQTIADYRSLGVFLSTFVRATIPPDGRMRCTYNIAGTETFRFSSSEDSFGYGTNLQNIPKGDE